ncbi:MAG: formate dehydrogenase accessory sulfurtransferase FdhD [Lewinella sp.]|uniref:formate dehydrogenase accessory sulfurtransferase FdhD n=1 Tax=Lewinella sp. TaxID=2004506 RepID=UPI003D6B9E42
MKSKNAHHQEDKNHATLRWENGQWRSLPDDAITPEWPLSIGIYDPQQDEAVDLAITMRTPGADEALIYGYLFTEGIIHRASDIATVKLISPTEALVTLQPEVDFRPDNYHRFGYTNSSCGLCGKTDLEQLQRTFFHFPIPGKPTVSPAILTQLPDLLAQQQEVFGHTGGIHAAALFNTAGKLLALQEDVGRHNALDKLIGSSLQQAQFPWRDKLVLLSGRISFELVQKAASAGTPLLAAIGAPSSLAIQLAEENGITLIGFLRQDRLNVYTYPERIVGEM